MPDDVVAEVIAEPVTKPRKKPATPADKLLADIEAAGLVPTESDKAEIAQLSDSDMVKMFTEMKLDTCFDPTELKKRSLYCSQMFKRINMLPIVASVHLYTIGGAQRIIDDTRNFRDGKTQDGQPLDTPVTNEERLLTLKLEAYTQTELSKMLLRAQKALPQVQGPPEAEKPPNKAPDSLAQPPVMVQNNGGTVHVHEAQPK